MNWAQNNSCLHVPLSSLLHHGCLAWEGTRQSCLNVILRALAGWPGLGDSWNQQKGLHPSLAFHETSHFFPLEGGPKVCRCWAANGPRQVLPVIGSPNPDYLLPSNLCIPHWYGNFLFSIAMEKKKKRGFPLRGGVQPLE